MTIRVINGRPHAYYSHLGLVPVRGKRPRDVQALDGVVALAILTPHQTTTVPGLEVKPDVAPPAPETRRPIGFRP